MRWAGDTRARVLMLVENNSYPRDPRVRREALALSEAGYRVSVISPAHTRQKWRETIDDIRVYRYPAPPPADGVLAYLVEYGYSMLAILLLSGWVFLWEGFDVIHAANPPDTLVLIAALYRLLGKRFIHDQHDLAPEMYYARFGGQGHRFVYRILIWCERLSCLLADQIITTNQSYKQLLMCRHRIPEERISIVRNGPDLNALRPAQCDLELRKRAGTIIAYAVLIGDGDAMPGLKELARKLAIDGYVWFAGWVDDTSVYTRYLSTADICVDPSPSNAYNDRSTTIKLMEYMALEKPIVAFDLAEHRFTARDAALYAEPNSDLELARAMAHLVDDPVRRRTMGLLGRSRVETTLGWCYSVPTLLQVYRQVLPGSFGKAYSA